MATPARQQYLRIKQEHPGRLLLFRMGDFYETFDEDARVLARELEIALTSREMGKGKRIPLAGIPYHTLEGYLAKLIRRGYHVAICEQTSDPSTSRGLLDREVVRVVTPGTVTEETMLDDKSNNYLASVVFGDKQVGLAYVDITTSEFNTSQFNIGQLRRELARMMPAEVLSANNISQPMLELGIPVTHFDKNYSNLKWATEALLDHFKVSSLEPFGCHKLPLAIEAAGIIVDQLKNNQKRSLKQITSLSTYSTNAYMSLDPQTIRNLELFEGGRWGDKKASLMSILDRTVTSMGGRLLRRWVGQPLLNVDELLDRQESVVWCHQNSSRRRAVMSLLKSISDLERVTNRIRSNIATPRDLVALGRGLSMIPELRSLLKNHSDSIKISRLVENIGDNEEISQLIIRAIEEDPSSSIGDGGVIRPKFSPELDAARHSLLQAQEYISNLETTERKRTGIKSLKVGFNKVFGYYIEISRSNLTNVPKDYIRKQTLVGGERYITPAMKEYESQVLQAQDLIATIEISLFQQVCNQVGQSAHSIMSTAQTIAQIDVFCSFAEIAARFKYHRPQLNKTTSIEIKQGRHPMVEQTLSAGKFVANDLYLSTKKEQLIILTGPNMAGKSTFIRQVALISLLAQIGSFVPAETARLGIVDRIFTRVGLQDDLTVGQSTFMIEMVETASILNQATCNSLVILDEIGRGTSTYDGLAIARSVAEYIHNHPKLGCKTLFATHYHELTQLAATLPRVKNYTMAVSEDQGIVSFLRHVIPGGADKSYGVHVARLAGLPDAVIHRAWEILKELETVNNKSINSHQDFQPPTINDSSVQQLPLIDSSANLLQQLLAMDVNSMSPIEAITKLYDLQNQASKEKI